nr:MAG TPA: hypothetical protein [Caudoviricetes sp.]
MQGLPHCDPEGHTDFAKKSGYFGRRNGPFLYHRW